jgi:hypothetical protein
MPRMPRQAWSEEDLQIIRSWNAKWPSPAGGFYVSDAKMNDPENWGRLAGRYSPLAIAATGRRETIRANRAVARTAPPLSKRKYPHGKLALVPRNGHDAVPVTPVQPQMPDLAMMNTVNGVTTASVMPGSEVNKPIDIYVTLTTRI